MRTGSTPYLPDWWPPERLRQVATPVHKVLAAFLQGCSPKPATRTVAATGLVLSLWQLRGRTLTDHVPSMFLLNAGEAAPDPVDEFVRCLVHEEGKRILRIDEGPDRAAFRLAVQSDPRNLRSLLGSGPHLRAGRKTMSVSGSLTLDLWDEELARGIIELGLPIVLLPHTGEEPLTIGNQPALEVLPTLWQNAPAGRATTSLMLPPIDWFEAHAKDVRRRLHLLPGPGTYQFAILQVLHQLGDVCNQVAQFAGSNCEATPEHVSALFWDLHARAFRGITLGVAALAWHCLGFDPGCPRKKATKALRDLRTKGPMSRSEVLVGARLTKAERDLLLERLVAEDLVRVEGKTVTATTFSEFVAALHTRPGLPEAGGEP